jgi:hypothetical protein
MSTKVCESCGETDQRGHKLSCETMNPGETTNIIFTKPKAFRDRKKPLSHNIMLDAEVFDKLKTLQNIGGFDTANDVIRSVLGMKSR